jgi:long-chain acyl-CoA synthetase
MNLARNLAATAERSPEAGAITFEGSTATYAELDASARAAAARLEGLGVGAGDRVALWMGNHPAFAAAMYGTWRRGGVVVPLHAMLTEPEARHILEDSEARAVFAGPQQEGVARSIHEVVVGTEWEAAPQGAPASVSGDDLALIAYTAGTSGVPKGAMLTHANLRANLDQMKRTPLAVTSADVVLCVVPLFHIFGLNVVLNLAVAVGARVVLFERFDVEASLEAIRTEGVSVVAAAPPVYVAWLASGAAAEPSPVCARRSRGPRPWRGRRSRASAPASA